MTSVNHLLIFFKTTVTLLSKILFTSRFILQGPKRTRISRLALHYICPIHKPFGVLTLTNTVKPIRQMVYSHLATKPSHQPRRQLATNE